MAARTFSAGSVKRAVRQAGAPPASQVGTVVPSLGASPPVSADGCCGLMHLEEVAHLAHRLGNQVSGLLAGVDTH
jgi:hypothetical protein